MAKILIVSVHPDDEALGAGGTLFRHKASGDELHWLILTEMLPEQGFSQDAIVRRQTEIDTVVNMLAIQSVHRLGYATMSLSPEVVNGMIPRIAEVFRAVQPHTVYVVNRSDAHSDHQYAFQAVIACTKSFRAPYLQRVLMYECLSETEFAPPLPEKMFIPNYYVDITPYLEAKLQLCSVYASEMLEHPFPRSLTNVQALATLRGATAGVHAAEAFQIVKWIDK